MEDTTKSDCTPGLQDAHAKEALCEGMNGKQSLGATHGCTRYDIADKLRPDEVAEDLKTVFASMKAFLAY